MAYLPSDVRYAIRTLSRARGFTLAAVLTLALGIGANTAIFSLVYSVLLKPLPLREPGGLVAAWDTYFPLAPKVGISPLELESMERLSAVFAGAAWYRYVPRDMNLLTPGLPAMELHATFISPRLLPLLGAAPVLGRGFSATENPQSALLNYRLWKSRFGGDASIVGRAIHLDNQEFTVAGVMPPDFQFPEATDLWLPPGPLLGDELTNPVRHALGFVGRLRPGATEEQARTQIETAFRRLTAEHPKTSKGFGIRVAGLQADLTAGQRPALLLLMGAVGLVLLIACGNVAHLMLCRGSGRAREIAIRTALGAGVGRLVRQLLAECWLLAAMGGGLGLALAVWILRVLSPIPAPLNSAVLLFLFVVSLGAGTAFGLAPAWQAMKVDPIGAIKSASLGRGGSFTAGGTLVILEFAFALVVVIGAGILVKSFLRVAGVDLGFNPRHVLTLRIASPGGQDPGALFTRIKERLGALPGVENVALANALPLIANRANSLRFNVPGSPLVNPDSLPAAELWLVSPDYFAATRIPLRSGRWFNERDLNQPVVIVNQEMARRFWPGKDPVGSRFIIGPWSATPAWATIVGVAGDVRQFGLDAEPGMQMYFPALPLKYLVMRTAGDPLTLAAAVERELQAVDRNMAIADVRPMAELVAQSAGSRRWTTELLSAFAGLALVLALMGIYGVTAWTVAQRTREIGIRMALGADGRQVRTMVVRAGAKLCGLGLAMGVPAALLLRHFLSSLAFEVSTADPLIYGGAAVLMIVTALAASYLPARRASRVDPGVAIRWE